MVQATGTANTAMNIDTELSGLTNNTNNDNNQMQASAFSSFMSRISGLVSRMVEYRPSNNNPTNNNSNETPTNQEENVDVDSREEPQAANNNNAEGFVPSSVININVEINESNEPPPPQLSPNPPSNVPPLETTVTNVNLSEDDYRSISTAIASSSVSIDIPAARGEISPMNNNDEPSEENSELSGARFNLIGISNSISQGKKQVLYA